MSFQKCPICEGAGIETNPLLVNTQTPCSICQGEKIISMIDGRPPKPLKSYKIDLLNKNELVLQEEDGKILINADSDFCAIVFKGTVSKARAEHQR